jgi:hypothetical protein
VWLHGEQELSGRTAAHVQEAPVHPLLQPCVLVDGQRRRGRVQNLDSLGDDFEATELDLGCVDDASCDLDCGLGGENFELGLQLPVVALVGHLHHAGVVAHDDELHVALQAERVHPSADGNGTANVFSQVGDGYATADHSVLRRTSS